MENPTERLDRRIESPILIGRVRQLEVLWRALDGARGGQGRVLILSGEGGIGKSRLISAANMRAHTEGFVCLQGDCFEPDRVLPYAPILDLVRSLIDLRPAELESRPPATVPPELIRLLPELAGVSTDVATLPPLEPSQERRRLFHALADPFLRLAAEKPTLMVVEDIHWADESSLEFLLYLSRQISDRRVLLLLSYRTEEARSGLDHFLADMEREQHVAEYGLSRLNRQEVDELIQAIFGLARPVRPEFLGAIYRLTEGNPFFLEEVLKSLIAEGEISTAEPRWDRKPPEELHIPRSIKDAVHRRTERLSPAANRVLAYAAVAGREFDFKLLQEVTGTNEQDLLEVMKELRAAQLVVERTADQFAFRHALTREAVYATLFLRERKTYHREIAQAMERIISDDPDSLMADLAYHFYEAGAWDETYQYSRRAGERAASLNAPREAIELFSMSLEAADHRRLPPQIGIIRSRGQAYETVGDFERARADDEQVLELARLAGDGVGEWQSLMDLGFLWASQDYGRTGGYFRLALERARTLRDPNRVAHTLNRVGNWLANTGRTRDGLASHREAMEIFEGAQNRAGMAETFDLMGMAYNLSGDIPGAIGETERAIDLFRELGDARGLASCLATRYSLASMDETANSAHGSPAELQEKSGEALGLARQIGWSAGQAFVEFTTGSTFGMFGEFGRALAHGREGLRIATEIEHQQWLCAANTHLGQTYVQMLQSALAVESLSQSRPLAFRLGSSWWIGYNTTYLALAHLLRRDIIAAETVLNEAMPFEREPQDLPQRRMAWAWGEVMLACGEYDKALRIADHLIESVPYPTITPPTVRRNSDPIPTLLMLKGKALVGLKRYDGAEDELKQAEKGADERGVRPLLWQIQAAQGRLYQRLKRREEAEARFAAAREIVQTLGSTIEDPGMREGFLRAASEVLPAERAVSPRRAAKSEFGNLTARERQVAALVAAGHSNPEIAATLVLSERTVTTHVSNILSKLGFASRVQIAAWAAQRKLI